MWAKRDNKCIGVHEHGHAVVGATNGGLNFTVAADQFGNVDTMVKTHATHFAVVRQLLGKKQRIALFVALGVRGALNAGQQMAQSGLVAQGLLGRQNHAVHAQGLHGFGVHFGVFKRACFRIDMHDAPCCLLVG